MVLVLFFPIHCLLYYMYFIRSALVDKFQPIDSDFNEQRETDVRNGINHSPNYWRKRKYQAPSLNQDYHKENGMKEDTLEMERYINFGYWLKKGATYYLRVPFNRFVLHSLCYGFFISIVVRICSQYIIYYNTNNQDHHLIQWTLYHTFLFIFVFSLILMDVLWFVVIKNNPLSGFWRIYDVCLHLLLFTYLVFHLTISILRQQRNCYGDNQISEAILDNSTTTKYNATIGTHQREEGQCNEFEVPTSISEVLFATGMIIEL